jgi:uncharacterized membrane protein (DUF2068 family)
MEFKKIKGIRIISILFFIMSLFFVYWIFYLKNNYNIAGSPVFKAILISIVLSIVYLISGIGLWKRKKYGKNLGIIVGIFFIIASLISFKKMIHPGVFSLFIMNIIILSYLILSKETKKLK